MQFLNYTPFAALGWVTTDPKEQRYVSIVASVKFKFDYLDDEGLWHLKFDTEQGELQYQDSFFNEKKRQVRREAEITPFKKQGELIVNLSHEVDHYGKSGVDVIRYYSVSEKKKLLSHRSTANLGFVHRAHASRMKYVGTPNQEWIEKHAPKYPKDFNELYYNGAHPKLQLPMTYFQPGDMIVLDKFLSGIHRQTVMIPGIYLKATNSEAGKDYTTLLEADTVFFDVENLTMQKNALYITYRKRILTRQKPTQVSLTMMLEENFIEKRSA